MKKFKKSKNIEQPEEVTALEPEVQEETQAGETAEVAGEGEPAEETKVSEDVAISPEEPAEKVEEEIPVAEETRSKINAFSESIEKAKNELSKDIVGMGDIIDNVLCAIIAGGNVLLEGVPGVGKTRLVRSLGRTLKLPFSRIQFTPDLMPSDVTGTNIIEQDEKGKMSMVFQRGPIFANLVLADEINRATPKTQSAMLEVMQELLRRSLMER